MFRSSRHVPTCTLCGAAVKRVHRNRSEVRTGSGMGLRRYRCLSPDCNWQGLLPRTAPRLGGARLPETPVRWQAWATAAALMATFTVAVILILRQADFAEPQLPPSRPQQDAPAAPVPPTSNPGTPSRP